MISFFRAPIKNITPQAQVSVLQIYKYITGDYAKVATERLRSIADPGEARRYKAEMFDYVTFSGCFSTRHNAGLLEHSGFLCFDIDKIETEEQLQNIKAQLITDEKLHTVLLFRSPSGNGLKWVVEVPDRYWLTQSRDTALKSVESVERFCEAKSESLNPDGKKSFKSVLSVGEINSAWHAERNSVHSVHSVRDKNNSMRERKSDVDTIIQNHRLLYERIRLYLLTEYGIDADHTSDIARPCYLCYDDDAFYDEPTFKANPASEFLIQKSVESVGNINSAWHAERNSVGSVSSVRDTETLVRAIEKQRIDITSDYHNWIRIAFAIASKHGPSGEEYFHRISQFNSGYDHNEAHKVYTSCLRNNNGSVTIATIVYLMNR